MARVSRHTKKYDRVIDIICKDLGIDRPRIKWVVRAKTNGRAASWNNEIECNPFLSTMEVIRVLMHELRHVWQYVNGYYKPNGWVNDKHHVLWKGKDYTFYHPTKKDWIKFNNLPWEIDARQYQDTRFTLFPGDVNQYLNIKKSIKKNNDSSLVVHFASSGKINYLRSVERYRKAGLSPYNLIQHGAEIEKIDTAINNLKSKGLW